LNQLQRWQDLKDLDHLNCQIARQINGENYDVLFAHTCMFTFIPALLQYIEIPSIYYLHEPFGPSFVRTFERPYLSKDQWRNWLDQIDPLISLYRRRLLSLQERSLMNTSQLLSNSQFTSNHIKASFGVDSTFCPIGADIETFRPMPDVPRENFVISVGELSPRKGFDLIVESLGKIPTEKRPALKLACNVIHEDEARYIEGFASHNNVELEVLTKINADELRLLYNQARICVYAPVMEPFGLVPLEAMACGTPIVAVNEGGVRESIVNGVTGCLVERNPSRFADAVLSLLEDEGLCRRFGAQARQHVVEKWNWSVAVAQLERYLQQTVARYHKDKNALPYPPLVLWGFAMKCLLSLWKVNLFLHMLRR
jgi:glycosyltransferase involved in cell wall biosynthesis